MKVLEVRGLKKTFKRGFIPKRVEVLKGVDFAIEAGTVTGFLGANGAGKTTTIKCLLELNYADEGEIKYFDSNELTPEIKSRIGFLPERPYFYEYLTGREFLRFYGKLGMNLSKKDMEERIDRSLEEVKLSHAGNRHLRQYSKGMLQRVGIAQALIHDPDLVILDEPMAGLDPDGRQEVSQIIKDTAQKGTAVFFSSHLLNDAEKLCDHLVILEGGKVAYQGGTIDLLKQIKSTLFVRYIENKQRKFVHCDNLEEVQKQIGDCVKNGLEIIEVGRDRQTLEQAFSRITSQKATQ